MAGAKVSRRQRDHPMSQSNRPTFRLAPARPPAVGLRGMVASSQGAATRAGLRMLERGGNAMDAALAAAAMLTVTEPMSTGIGGDVFAIVWRDGQVTGLDGAGPAPRQVTDTARIAEAGPDSVDVPGAVHGWGALAERFGRLGLDACLADAIDAAEGGFALGVHAAGYWRDAADCPPEWLPAPPAAARVRFPDMAQTLRAIADGGPRVIYRGPIAEAIARASWLTEPDLAAYESRWVDPLEIEHGGVRVLELPPPTQGVAALEALGLIEQLGRGLASHVDAVRLALEDAFRHVRDGADVRFLIRPDHLRTRALEAAADTTELRGGTVYLCAVDDDRMAVSLIQSVYASFGSGVLVPGTGIVLNNRAACFAVNGAVEPGRRPYHTIIPGMLLEADGSLVGPFGVMGGFIQAQAHVQFVTAALAHDMDPQAALDQPRFRVEGREVHLEPGLWDEAESLRGLGLTPVRSNEVAGFGGGQAIFRRGEGLVGGSDARKDGYAAGL
jgi:gamma-glutamyltranspeptidase / glutathione hydrolase